MSELTERARTLAMEMEEHRTPPINRIKTPTLFAQAEITIRELVAEVERLEWQAEEWETLTALAEGRGIDFDSAADLIAWLDAP